jgi:hypothetical protein
MQSHKVCAQRSEVLLDIFLMKYIRSRKFRALGILVASAMAIATATTVLATPYQHVGADTTGTDMTGPAMGTDGSGTDGSSGSHGGNTNELRHRSNPFETPQVKVLILQLLQAYQVAKTSNNFSTYNSTTLPAYKAQLLALGVRVIVPNRPSLTSPKPTLKGTDQSGSSFDRKGQPQFVAVYSRNSGARPAHTYSLW